MRISLASRAALVGVASVGLSACSPAEDATATDASLSVAAAFYPLEYVAHRIGGDLVHVVGLTPPGAEPHDVELTPSAVRDVRDADLVLYLSGFQPQVDDAVEATKATGLDVSDYVALVGADPHFWLDPLLLGEFAEVVTENFAAVDPDNAELYRANNAALATDLTALDALYSEGLASCDRATILTSHEAFGYLSQQYGLTQVGLSGINPEAEPSPARIREVRELAQSIGATTVFIETLVDPSVVEAFAQDAGLEVAILDPIGGLVVDGDDYLIIMHRNLEVLRAGLGCR
jgi:zinc transport system substrate-binding protein